MKRPIDEVKENNLDVRDTRRMASNQVLDKTVI